MHARLIAATLVSLSFASQAMAWGCIGQDCNQAANQVSFSAPESESYNDKAKTLAWGPTPGQGWQWSSCNTGDEIVDVDSIVVSPDPPVPGQNLTVRAKGTLKDEVSVSSHSWHSIRISYVTTDIFDCCYGLPPLFLISP